MKLKSILDKLESLAPLQLAENTWDNSGIQIANLNDNITGILLCLDITDDIIKYSIENGINLIVSHHPLLFKAIKSINYADYKGRLLINAIKAGINIYSMHTNLDRAIHGVNYALAHKLKLCELEVLKKASDSSADSGDGSQSSGYNGYGYGFVGNISEPMELNSFANNVAELLSSSALRYCGEPDLIVKRVAVCGGSGADFICDAVNKNADVYITGDIGHHDAQLALENNLAVIDAGHFDTEKHVLPHLRQYITAILDDDARVEVYNSNKFDMVLPY